DNCQAASCGLEHERPTPRFAKEPAARRERYRQMESAHTSTLVHRARTAAAAVSFLVSLAAADVLADCTGDCRGGDGVTLGEVQKAFDIFIGGSRVEECAVADSSGNGEVAL